MLSKVNRFTGIKALGLVMGLLITSPGYAALDELFRLYIGGTVAQMDANVRFTSRDGTIDEGVDLEDDVGYDPTIRTALIRGWYRFGDNHRIALTYVPSNRTSLLETQQDITIGDDTIKAGAVMAWDTQNRLIDVSYIYSLYHRPHFELGLSAGVYWLRNETNVLVAGEVQSSNEPDPVFRADYQNSFKLHAPLAILGLILEYELNPSWRVHGTMRYLSATINEYNGSVFNGEIGTEYFFNKSLGLGASLTDFALEVEVESIVLNGALRWKHNGAQLYMVYKY